MKEYFISAVIAAARKIGEFFGAFVGGRATVLDIIDEGRKSHVQETSVFFMVLYYRPQYPGVRVFWDQERRCERDDSDLVLIGQMLSVRG